MTLSGWRTYPFGTGGFSREELMIRNYIFLFSNPPAADPDRYQRGRRSIINNLTMTVQIVLVRRIL